MANLRILRACILTSMVLAASTALSTSAQAQFFRASDPGVRGGAPGAGEHLPGLTTTNPGGGAGGEVAFFELGKEDFASAEDVADGVGPRFNLDSCGGCPAPPAPRGSPPAGNPPMPLSTAAPAHVGDRAPAVYQKKRPRPPAPLCERTARMPGRR